MKKHNIFGISLESEEIEVTTDVTEDPSIDDALAIEEAGEEFSTITSNIEDNMELAQEAMDLMEEVGNIETTEDGDITELSQEHMYYTLSSLGMPKEKCTISRESDIGNIFKVILHQFKQIWEKIKQWLEKLILNLRIMFATRTKVIDKIIKHLNDNKSDSLLIPGDKDLIKLGNKFGIFLYAGVENLFNDVMGFITNVISNMHLCSINVQRHMEDDVTRKVKRVMEDNTSNSKFLEDLIDVYEDNGFDAYFDIVKKHIKDNKNATIINNVNFISEVEKKLNIGEIAFINKIRGCSASCLVKDKKNHVEYTNVSLPVFDNKDEIRARLIRVLQGMTKGDIIPYSNNVKTSMNNFNEVYKKLYKIREDITEKLVNDMYGLEKHIENKNDDNYKKIVIAIVKDSTYKSQLFFNRFIMDYAYMYIYNVSEVIKLLGLITTKGEEIKLEDIKEQEPVAPLAVEYN